jgi:CRP/FNR family transcriptional regulator, cyclic AMP receptor protein
MPKVEIAALKQIPLFSNMDDQEISGILSIMDEITYEPGQVILREGEQSDEFYVLTSGTAQIIIRDASGGERIIDDIGVGGFFGELSMLTGEPRSARVKAVERVETLVLDRDEFFDFLQKHPHAAIDVLTELGRRLHRADGLLRQSVSRNVNVVDEERLTVGQRFADTVADTIGSWRFIIIQSCLLFTWIVLNVTAWVNHWDPYPFILLNLALSFQAAYSAPFIMMSQNRQSMKDRLAAEIDHEVNTKAEIEVGLLLQRIDDLEQLMVRHNRINKNGQTPEPAPAPQMPSP